ncbi:hypothetical protein J3R83DRAFT_3930 [Lanmaoa asiatica]|nr:hypothetical protein J3R83DRAFT_3930 [Lanmaoa asiatica]
MSSSKPKPLPLSDTLRDLALLRASGVDFSSLLSKEPFTGTNATESSELMRSTVRSHEFVNETRGALRVYNSGELQRKRAEIQKVQGELDDGIEGFIIGKRSYIRPVAG